MSRAARPDRLEAPASGRLGKIRRLSRAVSIRRRGSAASGVAALAPPRRLRGRTRWWLELLTVAWLCWCYEALTNAAPLRLQGALAHAGDILHLEQSLHLDPELGLDHWLAAHHTLGLLVSDYYDNAHFIVTFALLGWLWWRRADAYRPLRNSLVLINLIGFAVFWRYPVAPPRMLGGFIDVVSSTNAIGSSHSGALASHADELAAMPSLHLAWAAWCTLAIWRVCERRWVRALAVLYPCLTAFAVVATGNHFVLDILAGVATTALAAALARLGARLPLQRIRAWRPPRISRWRPAPASLFAVLARSERPRYRMSQSCYEVQDQVD
jgi:hypothetical protein